MTIEISADHQGFSPQGLERIGRVLQQEIDSGRLPGAVGLIQRASGPVWHAAIGRQSPSSETAMNEKILFRIFSMTKPLVSLATLQLMEEGRLMLSQPVSDFVPEFADQKVCVVRDGRQELEPAKRAATVHDLLRHTAGLTYEWLGNSPVQRAYAEHKVFDPMRSNAELTAAIGRLPLQHQPGSCWDYSRATDVLGRVVEVASAQSLGDCLSERVFAPLQMPDTGFAVSADHESRIAEPFDINPVTGETVRLFKPVREVRFESGGGGLVSTLPDYANFLSMMLAGGIFQGRRLLSRKGIDLMTADHLGDIPGASDLLSPGHGFGLGFAVRTAAGQSPVPGSVGLYYWGGVAGTTFWVDPHEGFYAMLMLQAPPQRDYYRMLFRTLVYAALD